MGIYGSMMLFNSIDWIYSPHKKAEPPLHLFTAVGFDSHDIRTSDSNPTLTVYHRDMTIQAKESGLSPSFLISLKLSKFQRWNDAKTLL